ncbi:MAG TPA: helix-turn-helix domain-containing protein [Pyrinomonadaceae bacterium]|nr:helix-turn-helix domain-containing protein [Pyrinomonadaceae bacterium]
MQNTLLDTAEAVVVHQGIANLTLDAVAAEAGMSKGGLLHHFPTKDRRVEALVMRSAENRQACYMVLSPVREASQNPPAENAYRRSMPGAGAIRA